MLLFVVRGGGVPIFIALAMVAMEVVTMSIVIVEGTVENVLDILKVHGDVWHGEGQADAARGGD